MMAGSVSPVVLVILDGWGYRAETDGNAIANAHTPVMDSLMAVYPHTFLEASGKAVGLPKGQMGNSEVGHLNIGAGRIVPQELVRISDAVEDGSILSNPALLEVCDRLQQSQGKLHLIGLCSDGGVHSHLDHLLGLLDLAKVQGIANVCVHIITDGRDTSPMAGINFVRRVEEHIQRIGLGRIATIGGRYYFMDRDKRWDRVQRAYEVLVRDEPLHSARSATEVLRNFYGQNTSDEFIPPTRLTEGAISAGDGVIFFNFRPDRARQLTQALVDPEFKGFARELIQPLYMATFTQYDPNLPVLVAFPPQNLTNLLGQVIAHQGLKQFRTAETEKYAHVTYFFDGGNEDPLEGCDRQLVNSPMVATYDQAPEMSARAVTQAAIEAVHKGIYSLIVVNYANPDMVGHTGNYEAAVKAIAEVDACLGLLLGAISQVGGTALITADHGNAEYMWDEKHQPWTAHTCNPVPFILVEGERRKIPGHGGDVQLRSGGKLADIAPTILQILGIPQPPEMTGESLILPASYEVRPIRTPIQLNV
ncbi:MAG: 2,3-bisphosphoglycerate-independent phosphoglycerate mutase [Pseudanabaenaceae cyanobacterium]